jgi:fibro-slime domain-containing protein
MKRTAGFFARAVFCAVAAAAFAPWGGRAAAQTEWVPVTFYDFRSDRSNPEFEQPHNGGRRTGMVLNNLDADGKPQAASPAQANMMNMGVRFWFRDWADLQNNPKADGTRARTQMSNDYLRRFRPIYLYRGNGNDYTVYPPTGNALPNGVQEYGANFMWMANAYSDTSLDGNTYTVANAYQNHVVLGELPFTPVAGQTGMYEFNVTGFFPFNDTTRYRMKNIRSGQPANGFGNEGRNNHFSFTMEMVYEFTARSGMTFNFRGDDDVWVFIDNRLVLDIGGIHEAVSDNFRLDDVLSASEINRPHVLRVFYAERHTTESNIRITTNIVSAKSLSIVDNNGRPVSSEKNADEKDTLRVIIRDDIGQELQSGRDYECKDVVWTITNTGTGKTATHTGCSYVVADSIAGTIRVEASWRDPATGDVARDNASIANIALSARYIRIQSDTLPKWDVVQSKGEDIFLSPGEKTSIAYAALYDRYGNMVGWTVAGYNANNANWIAVDDDVVRFGQDPNGGPANATGRSVSVTQQFVGEGSDGRIAVSYRIQYTQANGVQFDETARDTVFVGTKAEPGIAVGPNPFIPGVTSIDDAYKGTSVPDFYRNAINNSGGGTGILIAVDAPARLQVQPGKQGAAGGPSFGRVMIYDAVGNIVMQGGLYQSSRRSSSYAYVWNGKNTKGRTVSPGTYLVRVIGKEDKSGDKFMVQRKIGVTKK